MLLVFMSFALGDGLVVHGAGQIDIAVLVIDQDWFAHFESQKSRMREMSVMFL